MNTVSVRLTRDRVSNTHNLPCLNQPSSPTRPGRLDMLAQTNYQVLQSRQSHLISSICMNTQTWLSPCLDEGHAGPFWAVADPARLVHPMMMTSPLHVPHPRPASLACQSYKPSQLGSMPNILTSTEPWRKCPKDLTTLQGDVS